MALKGKEPWNKGQKKERIISKEELINLYIDQNLTRKELAEKLSVSEIVVKNLIKEYDVKKPISLARKNSGKSAREKQNNLLRNLDFIEFSKSHNIDEISNKFSITKGQAKYACKVLGISYVHKPIHTITYDNEICKDVIDYYKCHTKGQTMTKFNITSKKLFKLLEDNNVAIHTDVEEAELLTLAFKTRESNFSRQEVREARDVTMIERYGCIAPIQNKQIREQIENTNLKKYGEKSPIHLAQAASQTEQAKAKRVESLTKTNLSLGWPAQRKEVMDKIIETNTKLYGVPYFCMTSECRTYSTSESKPNVEFKNLLISNNVKYSTEFPLSKYSYDFKVGDNTLIEVNPTATHNTTFNIFGNEPLSKDYHKNKSLVAKTNGYRCIHIWDWDNKEAIIKLLSPRETIYARNTIVKEVSKNEAKEFISTYHIQGYARDSIRLGLYFKDELVSIMTFDKPRYNKHYEYELVRYCTSKQVIGGSEKLFKHFLDQYKPNGIVSYCDLSKFNGDTYIKLGFQLERTSPPAIHWYNLKTKQHFTDNLVRQRGVDQLLGTEFGKGESNTELLLSLDFVRVCDCGQATYVYC